ncbi:UDP-4-amino-4,6-dideoxy-N-acetyl-beta-L-altrosamine N-acetyltransferase [Rubripirellula amarantea]|uniref:Spermidine N(1)-acetyltransferase n=1 Tax=Rubripirellula amarantea TaxID=2527999 RepID=A0A5C5WS38_9BACT|nr:UDP-4-amino-4,6-dideoxy-N-acetyl-beta-L-altrosamine N-acetyltransferase [Rubripirellula amarantea]MDA8746202.1 UDP-4-amino-4,6-dideoxy-N-acetyl-beta-L-altrosamine N-acetyltransferase [Rubripirellula amarantea]TWT53724.1 Spermidine N(1)-acetyltransferase [Rubripirellula amarantea]
MSGQPRVTIVPINEEEHAKVLFEWRKSPEISRFMYTRDPIVWDSHIAWIRSLPQNQSRKDCVILLDGVPAGTVNLTEIDNTHRRCSFGMYVALPLARVQGVGAAAEVLVLELAFDDLKMHKVSCEVFASNPAPVAMHQRMGFKIEGTFRDHVFDDGDWIDVVRMSVLENEWASKAAMMRGLLSRLIG